MHYIVLRRSVFEFITNSKTSDVFTLDSWLINNSGHTTLHNTRYVVCPPSVAEQFTQIAHVWDQKCQINRMIYQDNVHPFLENQTLVSKHVHWLLWSEVVRWVGLGNIKTSPCFCYTFDRHIPLHCQGFESESSKTLRSSKPQAINHYRGLFDDCPTRWTKVRTFHVLLHEPKKN